MSVDYQGLAAKGFKGLKCVGGFAWTLALNMLRRGLILGRYTLACWQKQKVNKAMRRLGEQFFQALERGETNPLVVSEVSDAVNRAKDLKAVRDKNYQAMAATGRRSGPPGSRSPRRCPLRQRRQRPPSRLRPPEKPEEPAVS